MVSSADLVRMLWSLRRFNELCLISFLNVPQWKNGYWEQCLTVFVNYLLAHCYCSKSSGGCSSMPIFLVNITPWACLIGSESQIIFHWLAQLLIFTKSLFTSSGEVFTLWTTENNKVSSADSLAFDKLSARSFLYIRNRSGPNAEPWGAHALTPGKEKVCTLSTTLCFVFLKKLNNKFKMISHMLFCLSLKIIPLCHTLSNALKLGIH